jgi:hypothetical protein
MFQQQSQALLEPTGHSAIMTAPKQTVVHQQGVSTRLNGRFNESAACCHTRHDVSHLLLTFYLQSIGAVVFELRRLQQGVAKFNQMVAIAHVNEVLF